MSLCVVRNRQPLRTSSACRATSRCPPMPANLPCALQTVISRSCAAMISGSVNWPGLPMFARRSLLPRCRTSTPSTAAIDSRFVMPSTVSIMQTRRQTSFNAATACATGTER